MIQHYIQASIYSFVLVFIFSATAHAGVKEFNKGQWKLDANFKYFNSTSNYDAGGNQQDLPYGGKYTLMTTDVMSRYVINSVWSMNGGLQMASAMSDGIDARRVNTSMPNMYLGTEWVAYVGAIDLIPEVQLIIPLEKISNTQDVAINSEGTFQMLALLNAQKEFDGFALVGGLGYLSRDARSTQIPWKIGVDLDWSAVRLSTEIRGVTTTSADKDQGSTNETARNQLIKSVNAWSNKFYSINPGVTEVGADLRWKLSQNMAMTFGGAFTISGVNAASGWTLGLGLGWNFSAGLSKRKSIQVKKEKSKSIDPFLDSFHEEMADDVDQNLFKPLNKPAVTESAPETETYSPTPVQLDDEETKKAEAKKQLDNYEMQIELRSKKKKKR